MPANAPSLRLRLVVFTGVVLALALALVGAAVEQSYRQSARVNVQERLESTLYVLVASMEVRRREGPSLDESLTDSRLQTPGSGLYAGIVGPNRSWESPSLLGVENPPEPGRLEVGANRFTGPERTGDWFVYAMGIGWELDDGRLLELTLWSAEPATLYAQEVGQFRESLWYWLLIAAAVIIAAQWLILYLILKPLRAVAGEIREVEAGRREQLRADYPRELLPLTANLNALLATERANAERHERALGDLAHALKTPLAVLKVDLAASGGDPEHRRQLETMERLLRENLDRVSLSTRRTMQPPLAVHEVIERLCRGLERLYAGQNLDFQVDIPPGLTVLMSERDLMELAGNLLDNAAKYGAGRVRVSAEATTPGDRHPGINLLVEDDGPGIERERWGELLQRGVRGDERQDGQGLGLAIAADLAAAHGGRLEWARSRLGGAAIRVILPPR